MPPLHLRSLDRHLPLHLSLLDGIVRHILATARSTHKHGGVFHVVAHHGAGAAGCTRPIPMVWMTPLLLQLLLRRLLVLDVHLLHLLI